MVKFGIPTSKNIGGMHWTRSGTEGGTEGRKSSAITICLPEFLWGHKKLLIITFFEKVDSDESKNILKITQHAMSLIFNNYLHFKELLLSELLILLTSPALL